MEILIVIFVFAAGVGSLASYIFYRSRKDVEEARKKSGEKM
jgi:hypothetical protein